MVGGEGKGVLGKGTRCVQAKRTVGVGHWQHGPNSMTVCWTKGPLITHVGLTSSRRQHTPVEGMTRDLEAVPCVEAGRQGVLLCPPCHRAQDNVPSGHRGSLISITESKPPVALPFLQDRHPGSLSVLTLHPRWKEHHPLTSKVTESPPKTKQADGTIYYLPLAVSTLLLRAGVPLVPHPAGSLAPARCSHLRPPHLLELLIAMAGAGHLGFW